jgi:hypothetical protein
MAGDIPVRQTLHSSNPLKPLRHLYNHVVSLHIACIGKSTLTGQEASLEALSIRTSLTYVKLNYRIYYPHPLDVLDILQDKQLIPLSIADKMRPETLRHPPSSRTPDFRSVPTHRIRIPIPIPSPSPRVTSPLALALALLSPSSRIIPSKTEYST